MINCKKCKKEMDYLGLESADTNVKDGSLWIIEKWECLDCKIVENVEFFGKITEISRDV